MSTITPPRPRTTSFNYGNFESVEGLALVGTTTQARTQADGLVLRLTRALNYQQGSAWYAEKAPVALGFNTTFGFRVSEAGGLGNGADGFSFSVQNLGSDQLVGEFGTPQQLSVRFETFNDNSVYIHHLGSQVAGAALPRDINLKDGNAYVARISVSQEGKMIVLMGKKDAWRLTDDLQPVLPSVKVDLRQFSPAFVGFGGRTGAGLENHDILSWEFQTSPSVA
jgi:hypothetical protein